MDDLQNGNTDEQVILNITIYDSEAYDSEASTVIISSDDEDNSDEDILIINISDEEVIFILL